MVCRNLGGVTIVLFTNIISTTWFQNLKFFQTSFCGGLRNQGDLFALVQGLGTHTPKLEDLDFTHHSRYTGGDRLAGEHFRRLVHLKKLAVDFNLLVPPGDNDLCGLASPHKLFPQHLDSLVLAHVSTEHVHDSIVSMTSKWSCAEDPVEACYESLALFASDAMYMNLVLQLFKPQTYAITVEDVEFLRAVADQLFEYGFLFELHIGAGPSSQTLVKAGFTAPALLQKAIGGS